MTTSATAIKYFCDTVELESFSLSAKKNFVSQSAMSQAIKRLEKQCGFSLFYHSKNHFQLTPEGRVFYEKASQIVRQFISLDDLLADVGEQKQLKLRIGCMHSMALSILPEVLPDFQLRWPHVEIDLHFAHGGMLIQRVSAGGLDFAILLDNDDLSQLYVEEIHQGHFGVYRSALREEVPQKYLLSDPSYETNLFLKEFREAYGSNPDVAMRIASWEVIASLAENGVGYGFFPDYLTIKHPHVTPIGLNLPLPKYAMIAAFCREVYTSKPSIYLIQLLKQALATRAFLSGGV